MSGREKKTVECFTRKQQDVYVFAAREAWMDGRTRRRNIDTVDRIQVDP